MPVCFFGEIQLNFAKGCPFLCRFVFFGEIQFNFATGCPGTTLVWPWRGPPPVMWPGFRLDHLLMVDYLDHIDNGWVSWSPRSWLIIFIFSIMVDYLYYLAGLLNAIYLLLYSLPLCVIVFVYFKCCQVARLEPVFFICVFQTLHPALEPSEDRKTEIQSRPPVSCAKGLPLCRMGYCCS